MPLKKSLKNIRKEIVSTSHIFKTIRRVYTHLETMRDEDILDYYHVKSTKELEEHIECIKKTIYTKKDNYQQLIEALSNCFCQDSEGLFKELYSSEEVALKQIQKIQKEQNILLKTYPCPYQHGWHLSKA